MNSRIITLLKFRYSLLWAQVRTSRGQIALLFFVYLVLLLVAVFMVLGGFGAAIAGAQTGRAEEIARGLLAGLMTSGIMSSLFFGIGPKAAFSDAVLRRYPLTALERLAVRHFLGIIDPIWAMVLASTFGFAIGLVILGQASLLWALTGAFSFVAVSYLVAILALSLLDRILQSREGSSALKMVTLGLMTFSALGVSWFLERGGREMLIPLSRALIAAPPGVAARLITTRTFSTGLIEFGLLLGWGTALLILVYLVESLPKSSSVSQTGSIDWENGYDRLAKLLGGRYPSLFAKSLRYHLRSNRVRFGLLSSPVIVLLGKVMARDSLTSIEFYFALGFLVAISSGASVISLNHYGVDGQGVVRYGLIPSSFAAPVRAGSLVAIFLGLVLVAPTILLWVVVTDLQIDWRMIVMLAGSGILGSFIFAGAGMLTTVLSPRRGDFSSIMGNQLSLGANIFVMAVVIAVFSLSFSLTSVRIERVLSYWWVSIAAVLPGLILYVLAWRLVGPLANARRERLIKQIGG